MRTLKAGQNSLMSGNLILLFTNISFPFIRKMNEIVWECISMLFKYLTDFEDHVQNQIGEVHDYWHGFSYPYRIVMDGLSLRGEETELVEACFHESQSGAEVVVVTKVEGKELSWYREDTFFCEKSWGSNSCWHHTGIDDAICYCASEGHPSETIWFKNNK